MRPKLYLLLSFLFLSFSFTAYSQQFDWVTGGGSDNDVSPDMTKYMCTDQSGNIYALSTVGLGAITADTFNRPGSSISDGSFLITSYTCNGTLRWGKFITSNTDPCVPCGITVDSTGQVYVASYVGNANLYIDNDTVITGLQYEHVNVMKFDSNGHFDWIRYIGDNNFGSDQEGLINTIALDATQHIHLFSYVNNGVTLPNGGTSQYGTYDFTFDASGNVLNTTRLDLDSQWEVTAVTIDPFTNRLYVSGGKNTGATGDPNQELVYAAFVAAFNSSENRLWMDTIGNDAAGFLSIVYDKMGHLYLGGGGQAPFSFYGCQAPGGNSGIIIKMDTSGNGIWLNQAIVTTAESGIGQVTLLPNNLVVGAGIVGGTLTDGAFTITTPINDDNPYLTILDTSGYIFSLQELYGDGYQDWAFAITSDKVGNVYVGGQVEDSIWAYNESTTIPAYHSTGGTTDFFIMKYGMDCNCTSMPVANYSDTGALTKSFTYTGTTTGIDSVVWNFGDGSATTNSMSPVTHTYDSGSYEACVYAYSSCGSDMHCSRVTASHSEGIKSFEEMGVIVYPNPATNEINISTQTSGISYKLMSVTGSVMRVGRLISGNNVISTGELTPGIYILQMNDDRGGNKMVKIVKE